MQRAVLAEAFDGGDLASGGAKGRHQAGMHRRAVEPDGAGAAVAGIAALLDAEEPGSRRKVRRHWPGRGSARTACR